MIYDTENKVPHLMEKFINRLKKIYPNADVELVTTDGKLCFSNMVTQSIWIGYGLGYFEVKEDQPGHFFYTEGEYRG